MSGHRRKERCYVVVRTQGPSCLRFFLEICSKVAHKSSEYYSTCYNKVYDLWNRITADRIHKNTTTSSIRGILYNFPRSIRIVCRRMLKNERIIAVLEQAKTR